MRTALRIVCSFLVLFLSGEMAHAQTKPMVIRLTALSPIGHPVHQGLVRFAELVAERTKKQVEIQLFPASQLGDQPTQMNMVKIGSVEMGLIGSGILGMVVPEYNVDAVMYIYRDRDHLQKVWRGPIARELADKFLATQGVRTLNSIWEVGLRHVLAKKPVRRVEDLNGLKIRSPESALFFEGLKALGARPTTIAFAEVYTALQLGTVDAMECPLDWIYTSRFHEVAKYLTLTGHMNNIHSLLVNEKFWQTLSPDIQKVLVEAGLEAGEYANLQIKNSEADYQKKMEQAGVTFFSVDTGPFQRKAEEALPKVAHIWGGDMKLAERVRNTR